MDVEQIRRQRSRWIDAINAGSADGFVAVLTDDAVWLPAGSDAIAGRDAIRRWLEAPFAELDYQYAVSDVSVRLAGDRAIENATFRTRTTDRDGHSMPIHEGRYTLLWRRSAAGRWLIERYIDHSSGFVADDGSS